MKRHKSYALTRRIPEASAILLYNVVETVDRFRAKTPNSRVYSVACVLYDRQGELETAFYYDIARKRERAIALAEKLCENSVTPATLGDVLEDII